MADQLPLEFEPPGRDGAWWRRRRRLLAATVALVVVAVGWTGLVAAAGSQVFMYGDWVSHGCPTPAARYGWTYEAVNYDITLDTHLPADNPTKKGWLEDCPHPGLGSAGDEVVAADGVHLSAWYIPSGDGAPATAPTVVIAHGWGVSKSDGLRYAAAIHDHWNVLVIDTRHTGRASGDWMSFGVREVEDLKAMLDWLERTKHPSRVAVLGDSGGAAAAVTLAPNEPRIAALVLESPYARLQYGDAARLGQWWIAQPVALSVPIVMAAVWLRTGGVWLGGADPADSIGRLGDRPVAISYGTGETTAIPQQNALALYQAAADAGVPVEIHPCRGADHGQAIDRCPDAYAVWLDAFLERTIG